jgi:plastocyanin
VERLEGRDLLSTVTVQVLNDSFSPTSVTIHVGDTVHWVWSGSPHSTTSVMGDTESWDSGVHFKGFTFDHVFTNTGSFAYYCTIHGVDNGNGTASGMAGMVVVTSGTATLQSIAVTPANPGVVVGTTQQFLATGSFSDGSTQDLTNQVIWTSATPTVANVSNTGLANTLAMGTSVITASLSGLSGSTLLTVKVPLPGPAPHFLREKRVFAGVGRHRKLEGFDLFFNRPLDSGTAQDVGHYRVTQPGRSRLSRPVVIPVQMAMYNPKNDSVMLMLGKFSVSKPLKLTATGLLGARGAHVATVVTRL